jgi:flavorubredoxin
MAIRKIKNGITAVGALDWNRRLFDELIPLPEGTTYNSYLVEGKDKTVLFETVDPTMRDELFANLVEAEVERIDYIVAHHGEQDHSGCLPDVVAAYPEAMVICSGKAKPILMDLLDVPEDRFTTVEDNDRIDLGGRTLRFLMTPWVHWPETMVTYLEEDKILFSCDFFGSHLATSDLMASEATGVYHAAKRYYAEIMMPFRGQIRRNLEKLADFDIKMICPSHGPIYDKPQLIIDAYEAWTSDFVTNSVVIPYVSMHGSTQIMVKHLTDELIRRGITVKPFFLSRTDIGEMAAELVDAATVVIGTPTVLANAHPLAIYAATLVAALKPKTRFASVIGSYGWGGRTVDTLTGILSGLPLELVEPVLVKGYPREDALARVDALADEIAEKHKTL